jgi:hypothetical protein
MELDDYNEDQDQDIISRKGYKLKDLAKSFIQCLGETGTIASGRIMHLTADIVTSGGLQLWQKLCWDYGYEHIGVASPRVFLYLLKKFRELNELSAKVPFETFCRKKEIQETLSEIVLIIQDCPKKTKTKLPSVPPDTHENENWLRSVLRTTDKLAVRKVYQRNADLEQMLHAGNEMVYAIQEGATERALFWVKWLLEEDAITKKKFGSGLTTIERGPAQLKPAQKTSVGYYLIAILAEVYKEFAEKGMIRMHEEFQALLDIYRSTDFRMTQKRKMDTMALMVQILTDVPKWKVPAAPSLVPDPTRLQRAVSQSESFFREVLMLPLPKKLLPATVTGLKQKKAKDPSKQEQLEQRLAAIDELTMNFYKMGK